VQLASASERGLRAHRAVQWLLCGPPEVEGPHSQSDVVCRTSYLNAPAAGCPSRREPSRLSLPRCSYHWNTRALGQYSARARAWSIATICKQGPRLQSPLRRWNSRTRGRKRARTLRQRCRAPCCDTRAVPGLGRGVSYRSLTTFVPKRAPVTRTRFARATAAKLMRC